MNTKNKLLFNKQKKELRKVGKCVIINNKKILVLPIGITVIKRQFPTKDKLQVKISLSILEKLEESEHYYNNRNRYNTLDPFMR